MDNQSNKVLSSNAIGVLYGALAFTLWGFLPLYWKLLRSVPSDQILAHRILWSFVFVTGLLAWRGELSKLRDVLKDRKSTKMVLLSAAFITANWGIYIWSVNADHLVEASMGYYINPLIVTTLGMTVLKERLNRLQYVALAFAAVGVAYMTVQYGRFPWIAVSLAVSFALYGLFKKLINVESTVGLALETMVLTPLTLVYILYGCFRGNSALMVASWSTLVLLLLSGVITALPLLWFGMGAKRVRLSTIGFLQYISPTIQLVLGVLIYKEPFSAAHLISFGFIWIALLLYSISNTGLVKKGKPATEKA